MKRAGLNVRFEFAQQYRYCYQSVLQFNIAWQGPIENQQLVSSQTSVNTTMIRQFEFGFL